MKFKLNSNHTNNMHYHVNESTFRPSVYTFTWKVIYLFKFCLIVNRSMIRLLTVHYVLDSGYLIMKIPSKNWICVSCPTQQNFCYGTRSIEDFVPTQWRVLTYPTLFREHFNILDFLLKHLPKLDFHFKWIIVETSI